MPLGAALKDRRVVVMTVLGLASGILCSFVYEILPLWRELSVGVSFGILIGAYLFHLSLTGPVRAVTFAVLTVLSCLAAERAAIEIFDSLGNTNDFLSWPGLVTGISAGLIGAGLLVLSIMALCPFFRQPRLAIATVLVGGATGALLTLTDVTDGGLVLFPIWQAAVAFCFALGFPTAEATEE